MSASFGFSAGFPPQNYAAAASASVGFPGAAISLPCGITLALPPFSFSISVALNLLIPGLAFLFSLSLSCNPLSITAGLSGPAATYGGGRPYNAPVDPDLNDDTP